MLLAEAHAAVGAFSQGERLFTQLRRTSGENVAAVTNFDPTFHAGLEAEANRGTADLPTVLDSRAVDRSNDLIVFAAADFHYFQRFGRRFVESFVRSGGGSARLALHIFDVTDEERVGIIRWLGEHGELRWSLSSEWTGLRGGDEAAAKGYYHAARYVRFWQFLTVHQAAAWIVDLDMTFNAPTQGLSDALYCQDMALFLSPARFEVRNKIMACCAGFSNTREAHDYLRNVAGYICHYQREGRLLWGIDQVALFAVAAMGPPAVAARIKGVSDRICSPAARSGQILCPAKVG